MFEPLHNNVLLEKEEAEKKTASGIILSDNSKDKPNIAKVLAVGKGKEVDGKLVPMQVKVDDRVVYKEYSTTEIKVNDKTYLIVSEDNILAIVK
ncbi:MAG: co-chaperone GroES [Erysipelotrichaceae bacterium]|jgi:chaperonin GroES|nr:co-chaperone GroES [Erysipelotrichaceae bacterium]